jgi:hypothetical protein
MSVSLSTMCLILRLFADPGAALQGHSTRRTAPQRGVPLPPGRVGRCWPGEQRANIARVAAVTVHAPLRRRRAGAVRAAAGNLHVQEGSPAIAPRAAPTGWASAVALRPRPHGNALGAPGRAGAWIVAVTSTNMAGALAGRLYGWQPGTCVSAAPSRQQGHFAPATRVEDGLDGGHSRAARRRDPCDPHSRPPHLPRP